MARFKKGTDTGFIDVCTHSILVGDGVENTINGVKGVVTSYGVVEDSEGNKHKLSNQVWKVITPFDVEITAPKEEKQSNKLTSLSDDVIIEEVCRLGPDFWKRVLAVTPLFLLNDIPDEDLATILRQRGYELTATKTISL